MAELEVIPNSILDSVKKVLGFEAEYDAFDPDIIMHINSTFFVLNQLAVGPEVGFIIEDRTATWDLFIGDAYIPAVKTYVYLKVRQLFDPPTSSFALDAMKQQATEYEWRLNIYCDRALIEAVPNAFWWELDETGTFPEEAAVGDVGWNPATGKVWRKT